MRWGLVCTVVAALVLALLPSSPGLAVSPRVVNGSVGSEGQFPFMVALLEASEFPDKGAFQSQFCAGSLTTSTTIVTAAHCVVNQDNGRVTRPGDVLVAFTRDLDSSNFPTRQVSQISIHPNYVIKSTENDVAVLTLSEPITNVPFISVLTPDLAAEYTSGGQSAQVAGWGNTLSSGNKYPAIFRVGNLVVFPDTACGGSARYEVNGVKFLGFDSKEVNSQVMLCAGGVTDKGDVIDACQGDSGGPLIANGSAGPMLIGLVSWGEDCAGKLPGVYTRISAETQFLSDNNAISRIAPTIAPAISITPLDQSLSITLTGGADGITVTSYAASVTGPTMDSPSTPVTQTCFAAPSKTTIRGKCSIGNLINGVSYQVTAISANAIGNSPVSAPSIGAPSELPIAGRIKKVVRDGSRATFTTTASNPNGAELISERIVCTPLGNGIPRSAKITNQRAVVSNLGPSTYTCRVVVTTLKGAGTSSARTVKR